MAIPTTFFDTAGRSSEAELASLGARVRTDRGMTAILDGVPEPIYLLNENRQIVVANQSGIRLARTSAGATGIAGLRLGEALACINAAKGPDGCGTAVQCRHCGAGKANRAFGIKPDEYTGEFRLRSATGSAESAQTFSVHLAPVRMNGSVLRLCTLTDITAAKSREALDHIFFHDVLNTAQAVQGAAGLIPGLDDQETLDELARVVSTSSATLVDEIEAQRDLLRAEDGMLVVPLEPEGVWQLVSDTADLYRHSRFAEGRTIDLAPPPSDDVVPTSHVHLSRSVGNLLKNALEASAPGDHVSVRVQSSKDDVAIAIHNPAVMPEAVQAQVFQRFFSTKAAAGRGLGTYSVYLLVTRILVGRVSFVSAAPEGTTFTIRLPRAPKA